MYNKLFDSSLRGRPISWIRYIVIIGILAISFALPFVSSPKRLVLLLAGIVGLGVVLIFLERPYVGIPLVIVASMLIPIDVGVSSGSRINAPMLLVILLTGLWFLDMVVRQRQIRFVSSRPLLPLVVFVVIILLSFVMGQLPWFAFAQNAPLTAQLGGLALFLLSVSAFFLVAQLIKDQRWLEWMTWLFLALGGIYVLISVLPVQGSRALMDRIFQYGSTSSQFWTWMMALSLSQSIFNKSLNKRLRVGLGVLALLTLYNAFGLVGWKSGWVPAAVVAGALISLRSWRWGALLFLCGVLLLPTIASSLFGSEDYSLVSRTEAWSILFEIIKINPIFGLGIANYYWYTPLYSILGYFVQFSSHNQLIDIVAQTGLLGLGAFLWLTGEVGYLGWRLRNLVPEGFPQAYVYGALAGLAGTAVATMLGDWVIPFVYNVGFVGFRASVYGWLFLGGIVALEQIYREPE